jgi:hypothetical protein
MNNPLLNNQWAKYEISDKVFDPATNKNKNITVHYIKNIQDGRVDDFKFTTQPFYKNNSIVYES